MDIKAKFVSAMEKTGDPLAPIKLQEAYKHCDQLGRLMAIIGNKAEVEKLSETLLASFPKDMDHIARDPNFICALSGLLSNALIAYGRSL